MKPKFKTTVSLDPEVGAYLDELAKKVERDRSWVINALARQHKRRVEEGLEQRELFDPSLSVLAKG